MNGEDYDYDGSIIKMINDGWLMLDTFLDSRHQESSHGGLLRLKWFLRRLMGHRRNGGDSTKDSQREATLPAQVYLFTCFKHKIFNDATTSSERLFDDNDLDSTNFVPSVTTIERSDCPVSLCIIDVGVMLTLPFSFLFPWFYSTSLSPRQLSDHYLSRLL